MDIWSTSIGSKTRENFLNKYFEISSYINHYQSFILTNISYNIVISNDSLLSKLNHKYSLSHFETKKKTYDTIQQQFNTSNENFIRIL